VELKEHTAKVVRWSGAKTTTTVAPKAKTKFEAVANGG